MDSIPSSQDCVQPTPRPDNPDVDSDDLTPVAALMLRDEHGIRLFDSLMLIARYDVLGPRPSLVCLAEIQQLLATPALEEWRRGLRLGVGGQDPRDPRTWRVGPEWQAALWQEAAARAVERDDLAAARRCQARARRAMAALLAKAP